MSNRFSGTKDFHPFELAMGTWTAHDLRLRHPRHKLSGWDQRCKGCTLARQYVALLLQEA